MRVTIDKSRCIAAGQCVLNAPFVFDQGEEDGIVILLKEDPPPEQEEHTRRAARLCPAEAIKLHD
ncbi:ferredoxin [Pararoseomonas indoligenes]|uniref:Ferredoxin n=1 Tax=Roseomonas indoligenes TaxID=2820811 RepID=A0A940N4M5_9PROT|nr:ferredoxin [Pararoseomonas indoligenes]MBP0495886.1 ferredoxin [Pararoseomonas indoligenes]